MRGRRKVETPRKIDKLEERSEDVLEAIPLRNRTQAIFAQFALIAMNKSYVTLNTKQQQRFALFALTDGITARLEEGWINLHLLLSGNKS